MEEDSEESLNRKKSIPHQTCIFSEVNIEGKDCDVDEIRNETEAEMPVLLQLFKDIYVERIKAIESNNSWDGNRKNEEKLSVLQKYLQDLQDQNETFVVAMMELEKEAYKRVKQMNKRLKSSAKTTMEAVINVHECEKEMKKLVKQRFHIDSLYNDMHHNFSAMKVENSFLRDQNFNLRHDVQALLNVIKNARSSGHWEMDCVTFCDINPEEVFGSIQSISNVNSTDSPQSEFHSPDRQNENRRYIFPTPLPSSGTSLSKCNSLPDLGNIYNTNIFYKSNSLRTFNNVKGDKTNQHKRKSVNSDKHYNEEVRHNEFQKYKAQSRKTDCSSSIRKAQSEPHLFMFGDNIYVYRPCENFEKASYSSSYDYNLRLPTCQSIDLRFPTKDSLKTCDWSISYKTNLNSYHGKCSKNAVSSCSCISDRGNEIHSKEILTTFRNEKVSTSVQTEKIILLSVGLQIDTKPIDELRENGCLQLDLSEIIRSLKESLTKAENKAEAKCMLIKQLQGHILSSVKEIELKDETLNNVEKKLQGSRSECTSLKQEIVDMNAKMNSVLRELEDTHMLNDNLKLKVSAKDEKIQEILTEQKVLQNQKRSLLIQLDSQEDKLDNITKELDAVGQKTETYALQIGQQSHIIRNLQEALVQSKRAFEAACPKKPLLHATSSEIFPSDTNMSRSTIMDV